MNKIIGIGIAALIVLGIYGALSSSGDSGVSAPLSKISLKSFTNAVEPSTTGEEGSDQVVASSTPLLEHQKTNTTVNIDERNLSKLLLESNQVAEKVLKTAEEQEFQQRVLASPKMLSYVFKRLDEDVDYKQRMQVVEFLAEAIRWKSNPIREQAIERAFEFISSDRLKNISDIEDRKMRAADHIEVMLTLMREEPDRFEERAATIQGEVNQKLIKFTKELYGKGNRGS